MLYRWPGSSTWNQMWIEVSTVTDRRRIALAVGGLRAGVGAALIAVPAIAGGREASSKMLVRTIGIRDLVLGVGTLLAAGRDNASTWMRAGLGSDIADVVLAVRSRAEVGTVGAVTAAVIPLPVIAAGVAHEVAR